MYKFDTKEYKKNGYEVIDNFIPEADFLKLKTLMMSDEFPWFYSPYITHENEKSVNNLFYMTHMFHYHNAIQSNHIDLLNPILSRIDIKAIIRIKANLYPNQGKLYQHVSHTDYRYKHQGALFSINTCNGGTIMHDGKKIDSIENRIIFFDPSKPHSSTNLTDSSVRINVNHNFFV